MCKCGLVLSGILVNIILVTAFNIDQKNYAVFQPMDNNRSMFGFTVAMHKDRGDRGWVLVGAPEGQSKFQNPGLVVRGGTVYKCRSDTDDVCQQVPFDKDEVGLGNTPLDEKSWQWFGATLGASGRKDGPVVACAPRYIWYTKDLNRRDPVGTCFVSNGAFDSFEEYSPCRTMNWGYHRQGSCQAGFSAAINREGDRLFVGAPGSYYWQGQMYSIDAHAHFDFTPGYFGSEGYGAKGSVHQQSLENRPAVFSTREGKAPDDDSYIGYSTVVGHFEQGQKYEGIAVGMPRGNKLRGKVLFFTWDLVNYKNITISQQIGSYFGYALAAADVNGDKLLDLIVGAPIHTESNTEDKYDVGRVYVFYQSRNYAESFNTSHFIDGMDTKGRFGHALASLGDLNQDGYDDFAVGAPYGGRNGRGAVYIYYGSKEGIRQKFGQVIYAESISATGPYLTTFGFSLAGGLDLDNNDYPDMAVGAYLSDEAFFFRARPVVFIDSYVEFLTKDKKIDIKKKNCILPNKQDGTCTSINFCIKYFGKGIPDQLNLKVQYSLDTGSKVPRMGFMSQSTHTFNSTIPLRKDGIESCKMEEIYMKNEIRDKLTLLEAEVKFFMIEEYSYAEPRHPKSQLKPILDLNNPPSRKDFIMIKNDCGENNICIPNLHVNVTSNVSEYLLDSNTTLEFDVIVSNFGQDSFETIFEMNYPKDGIFYKNSDIKIPGMSCSESENRTVKCYIGNPLPKDKIAKFKVLFQPYRQVGQPAKSYVFDILVYSSNPENNNTLEDNKKHIEIPIWIDASIDVKGQTYSSVLPLSHYFNDTSYLNTMNDVKIESQIGPQITHVYFLTNKGPSQIQHAEVLLLWPHKTLGNEDLLYLLEQPITKGNIQCAYEPLVNYRNLQVEKLSSSLWQKLNIHITSTVNATTVQTVKKNQTTLETGEGVQSGIGVENKNTDKENTEVNKGGGDSSSVIEHRHNVSTWGNLNPNGEYEYIVSNYYIVYENGVPVTKWENTTTIRDAHGNILRTLYYNDNTVSETGTNLDSLSYKIGLKQGEYERRTAKWYTTYVNGEPVTKWENRTIVTDLNGNVLRSYIWDEFTGEYVIERGGNKGTEGWNQNVGGGGSTITETHHGESSSSSWGMLNPNGEYEYTVSKYYIINENGVPVTKWENTTTIRDARGKILRTLYYNDNTGSQSGSNMNSLSYKIGLRQGEYEHKTAKWYTTYVNGEAVTKWENRTVVTDLNGNVLRSYIWDEITGEYEIERGSNTNSVQEEYRKQEQIKLEEERRKQQRIEEERRKQQRIEEERREQQRIEEERKEQQRLEEHRRQEKITQDRIRQEEERKKIEEQNRLTQEQRRQEELRRYEAKQRQEERKRLEEARRLEEERRAQEERYKLDEESRRMEERRRQEGGYPNNRYDEDKRREEERRREEWRRDQIRLTEERRRQEQWRKQQEEQRRIEEERRRQQSGTGNNWSDEERRYYEERRRQQSGGHGGEIVFNKTYVIESSTSFPIEIANGGQSHIFGGSGGNFEDLGSGFTVQTLDVSGGNRLDSRNSQESYGQYGRESSSTGSRQGSGSGQGGYRRQWHSGGGWSTSGQIPPTFVHNSIERDNVPTDNPSRSVRSRPKRDVPVIPFENIDEIVKCNATKCVYIRCHVDFLDRDQDVIIALRSRLNVRALRDLAGIDQPIKVSSMMVASITKLTYAEPIKKADRKLKKHEIFTEVPAKEPELVSEVAPLWIYVVSAVAGIVMLLLLIWLLSKCGFFKRNRPSSGPERQPLNRNGYHSGDEAL